MNQTLITSLIESKAEIFFPSLLIIYISFLITNLLVSWAVYSNKTNWGKVWTVWILTALIVGIIFAFISASPEGTLNLINSFKDWFN